MTPHKAIYPGSFDPPTLGHLDVLSRACKLFDEVVIAIGRNPDKKGPLLDLDTRVSLLEDLVHEMTQGQSGLARVTVASYDGLTVDFARSIGANAILRGIRNTTDLQAECQLAITNRQVADIESVFVVPGEAYAYTSSSLIRQIAELGGDPQRLSSMLAPSVISAIAQSKASQGGSA
jgi:pantetheine-phosphate adenylyltransferase